MKATSKSWKTQPLPAERARLKLERFFKASEREALRQGVIPEEMEDKRFIYEKDGWLSFHRRWAGRGPGVAAAVGRGGECDAGGTPMGASRGRDGPDHRRGAITRG